MDISPEELGRRLKIARERAGMTPEEVARALDLSPTDIACLESGTRKVSGLEIVQLASLYGRAVRDFFEPEFADDGVSVLLRALPSNKEQLLTAEKDGSAQALAQLLAVEGASAPTETKAGTGLDSAAGAPTNVIPRFGGGLSGDYLPSKILGACYPSWKVRRGSPSTIEPGSVGQLRRFVTPLQKVLLDTNALIDLMDLSCLRGVLPCPEFQFWVVENVQQEIERENQSQLLDQLPAKGVIGKTSVGAEQDTYLKELYTGS